MLQGDLLLASGCVWLGAGTMLFGFFAVSGELCVASLCLQNWVINKMNKESVELLEKLRLQITEEVQQTPIMK